VQQKVTGTIFIARKKRYGYVDSHVTLSLYNQEYTILGMGMREN
jgi:hypothetical protein